MSSRIDNLQVDYRKHMDALDALVNAAAAKGDAWTDEDRAVYDRTLTEAKTVKQDIEREQLRGALQQWQDAPDGQSAVKASYGANVERQSEDQFHSWSGESIDTDGNIPGMTMTPFHTEFDIATRSYKTTGGELVPQTKSAEARLKVLSGGAYKDALVSYLRAAARGQNVASKHMKVLQEGLDSAGGNFVVPEMRNEIIQKQATVMAVGNDVFKFQVGSNLVSFGKVSYTTNDQYSTGIRFSWTAEAPSADISEATNPVAGRVNIPIHTATAAIIVTREMLEDSYFDILGFISEKIGESFGLGLDDAFVTGDGVGKPQGILSHTNASVAIANGGMQVLSAASGAVAWGSTVTTGILGTEAALPPQYEANAKWYMNKTTAAAVRQLNTGTATLPQWGLGDSYPNYGNGYQPTLLGYPVRRDQFLPDPATTARPIILGDLMGYYAPMRTGITVDVLREIRALRGEVVIYARQRVGGYLAEDYRVKVLKSHTS